MGRVVLEEAEFDKLSEMMDKISMPHDNYIPSEEDLFNYIARNPEKYYKYLLWYSMHKPKSQNEEEKKLLKRMTKITNETIVIDVKEDL